MELTDKTARVIWERNIVVTVIGECGKKRTTHRYYCNINQLHLSDLLHLQKPFQHHKLILANIFSVHQHEHN